MLIKDQINILVKISDQKTNEIVKLLAAISDDKIDNKKLTISSENDFIKIRIFSKNNKHCPLYFEVGLNENLHKISIDFFDVSNILYYEDFSTDEGFQNVLHTVDGLLKNKIKRKEFYFHNTLLKIDITSPYFNINENETIHFTKKIKSCWFWQKTFIKEILYEPWC